MILSSGQEFSFYFVPISTLNFNVKEKISDKFEGKINFIHLICIISSFHNVEFIHIFYFLHCVDLPLRAATVWEICLLISPRLLLIFYFSVEWSKLLRNKNTLSVIFSFVLILKNV